MKYMKYAINIILVFWTTISYCQTDTLITPQLRHEIKRKILKQRFANRALSFIQNAVDEAGNFTGNKNRLSKREYIYGGSNFNKAIGFGYGYAKDLSINIEPFDWICPDDSWNLYKVKFSLKPELEFIRGVFDDISNTVREDRYTVIAINQKREVRFLSYELRDKKNLDEFVPAFDKSDPKAYTSWISFWVKFYDKNEGVEKITYLKEEGGKYWYNIVFPDSLNYMKVECSIPVGSPEEIKILYYANENFVYPKKYSAKGFNNPKVKDRLIKDNLMKNLFAYKLAEEMGPIALEEAIDNYFSSENSILDSLIPDFDDVFYFDMHVNQRFTSQFGLGSGRAYDVFVPECKVLKKSDNSWETGYHGTELYYKGLYPDKEYPYDYYSMDDEHCLDWSEKGFPAESRRAKKAHNKKNEEANLVWKNSKANKAAIQDYKKKMKDWTPDQPKPTCLPPPPPPPIPFNEGFELWWQPSIYKPDTKEKSYPNKERYTIAIDRSNYDVIFVSGSNIYLDPLFGYKFGHSNIKHGLSDPCCEDKSLFEKEKSSERHWKEYAALRLLSYSAPNVYIKDYLDHYKIVAFSPEKIIIETYGIKKDTPWSNTPIKSESFILDENYTPKNFDQPYEYFRYGAADRVKLRMTVNYEKDYEWFTVEEIGD